MDTGLPQGRARSLYDEQLQRQQQERKLWGKAPKREPEVKEAS